jgi:hypothetical protein
MRIAKIAVACLLAIAVLVPAGRAMAEETLKYVAPQASVERAMPFLGFMKQNDAKVDIVAPAEAEAIKKTANVIVIESGMDDPVAKKLITEVVGADEAAALSKPGAKKMISKDNAFKPGQHVLVFAGSDATAAADARKENRDTWLKYFKDWLGLEAGPETLKGY